MNTRFECLISIQHGTEVSEASGGYDMMAPWGDSLILNPFADEILAGYAPDAKMYEKDGKK